MEEKIEISKEEFIKILSSFITAWGFFFNSFPDIKPVNDLSIPKVNYIKDEEED
jgi:hypothetical protein